MPLFEENENKWFVELMLSWTNFEKFAKEMKAVANDRKKVAESKSNESQVLY